MKRILTVLLVVAVTLMLALPAAAQEEAAQHEPVGAITGGGTEEDQGHRALPR